MLRDLLAADERRALEFFLVHLRGVSEPSVAGKELLYNASVLAQELRDLPYLLPPAPPPE